MRQTFKEYILIEAALLDILKKADVKFDKHRGGEAVSYFVGHKAVTSRDSGIMSAGALEDAFSDDPSSNGKKIRSQLERSFAPIRKELEKRFGKSVRLYRGQRPVEYRPDSIDGTLSFHDYDKDYNKTRHSRQVRPDHTYSRKVMSWTMDKKVALDAASGVWNGLSQAKSQKDRLVKKSAIDAYVAEYNKTGKVYVPELNKTYVKAEIPEGLKDHPLWKNKKYYYDIYSSKYVNGNNHLTDGDDLPGEFASHNEWIQSRIEKDKMERMDAEAKIITAKVPLEDVVWVTNRAGQLEFIVRNIPGRPWYVGPTGIIPNRRKKK